MFAPVAEKPWRDIPRWVDGKRRGRTPGMRDLAAGRAHIVRIIKKPKFPIGEYYRIPDSLTTFPLRECEVSVILKDLKVIKIIRAWGSDNPVVSTQDFTPQPSGSYDRARILAEIAYGEAMHDIAIRKAQEEGELPIAEEKIPTREVVEEKPAPVAIQNFMQMEGPYSSREVEEFLKKWSPLILNSVNRVSKPGALEYDDLKSQVTMKLVSLMQKNGIRAEEARTRISEFSTLAADYAGNTEMIAELDKKIAEQNRIIALSGADNAALYKKAIWRHVVNWVGARKARFRTTEGPDGERQGALSLDVVDEEGFGIADIIIGSDGRDEVKSLAEKLDRDVEVAQGETAFYSLGNSDGMPESLKTTLTEVLSQQVFAFDQARR